MLTRRIRHTGMRRGEQFEEVVEKAKIPNLRWHEAIGATLSSVSQPSQLTPKLAPSEMMRPSLGLLYQRKYFGMRGAKKRIRPSAPLRALDPESVF